MSKQHIKLPIGYLCGNRCYECKYISLQERDSENNAYCIWYDRFVDLRADTAGCLGYIRKY